MFSQVLKAPCLWTLSAVCVEKFKYLCTLLCALWIRKYQGHVRGYPNIQGVENPVDAMIIFRLPRTNCIDYASFKVNFIVSYNGITSTNHFILHAP